MSNRTLLAVHAHPDDECISTGGVLARYAEEGVRTVLITCTDGAVGEISDPSLATPENLAEVRSRELDEATRLLNVSRLVKLGYRDSGMAGTADNANPASLNQTPFDEALERVVRVIREEQPQVLVTYDERGGYGHPDHIRAHQLAEAAFWAAGDATRFPSSGVAFAPSKLYYVAVSLSAMRAFGERLREAGVEAPFTEMRDDPPFGVPDEMITTTVDVSAYADLKRLALQAHRTQMGPNGWFMRLPPELWREAFGRESFERRAGTGKLPETDLFAGIEA